jgi:SH3-like domain-containing protein
MKKLFLSVCSILLCLSLSEVQAESTPPSSTQVSSPDQVAFEPFTGKIKKNKVRLRLQPTYDSQVLRDFKKNDLIVVVGETDDFYAIQPLNDMRAYIFRTFVLDNVVEGHRVNTRLKPELDAPVVAQLNSGDRVEGKVNINNPKWLEIKIPEQTRFYIAKEYVEKYGDAGLRDRLEKKQQEGYQLLRTTEAVSQAEMQKPFNQINLEGIQANYKHLLLDFPEFPEISQKAKDLQVTLLDAYTEKKVAYLEDKAKDSITAAALEAKNRQLQAELQNQKSKVARLEQKIDKETSTIAIVTTPKPSGLPLNMTAWMPIEEQLFNAWAKQTGRHDPNVFYRDQKQAAFKIRGIIEKYNHPGKKKPGDYMLVNSVTKFPIAYLYSTIVNLQNYVGHEVSILVSNRSNNKYAFLAYFVLSVE